MGNQHLTEELLKLSILYVEDDDTIREEVSRFLRRRVGNLTTAANGQEGLEAFEAGRHDIVLTDIRMPVKDGLHMAAEIKCARRDTPVVVVTVFEDPDHFQQAIELGVDGYVLKPVKLDNLLDTLERCVDRLMTARELATGRARLAEYRAAAEEERTLVADLMARMMRSNQLHDGQAQYWLQPAESIGGDLIALARNRSGRLFVMVADSTGHGLPAALNLLPINHIFYRMVSKNLPVSLIVEEMNWAVREQSPLDRYVSVLVACLDTHNRIVEVWNGGMPTALLMGNDGAVIHRFEPRNFPLGVLDRTLVAQTEIIQIASPGQLFVCSDGLEDAENEQGEAFGAERLENLLRELPPDGRFAGVRAAVAAHMGDRNAFDDIAFLQVEGNAPAPA